MTKWNTEKQFGAFLGLSPDNRISGGKVLSRSTRQVYNRAADTFTTVCPKSHPQQKRARREIPSPENKAGCSQSHRGHGAPSGSAGLSHVTLWTELPRKRHRTLRAQVPLQRIKLNGLRTKPVSSTSNSLPLSRFHHQFLENEGPCP